MYDFEFSKTKRMSK